MTQVPGDLTINQNIMFAGKMEVTQAVSFSRAYDIFLQISISQTTDFHFVFFVILSFCLFSQITISDFHSLNLTSTESKR